MKVKQTMRKRVAGFVRDWSLPRQAAGESHHSTAAKSTMSQTLRPRLEQADTVGTSICPFCAVGCSQLIYAKNGKAIQIEGDPRSPINQGTLCPKGAATLSLLERADPADHRQIPRALFRPVGRKSRSTGRWTASRC